MNERDGPSSSSDAKTKQQLAAAYFKSSYK